MGSLLKGTHPVGRNEKATDISSLVRCWYLAIVSLGTWFVYCANWMTLPVMAACQARGFDVR